MSRQVAEDSTILESTDQLLAHLRSGFKPPGDWGTGIEYERIGLFRDSGETVPYAGEESVESVLRELADRHGWTALSQEGHLLELQRDGAAVSLEPGAQMEFAGSVHRDLEALQGELCSFLQEAEEAAAGHGISFLGIGLNPFTPVERIGWIPKPRYKIMSRRLAARGKLAHYMMKATSGIQGNFDFSSEEDAVQKLRLAMGITSVSTALAANSPLYAGRPNRFRSMRGFIWLDTDPDRCGLLDLAFYPDEGYQRYLDYALSVPVLFVVRDGRWIDMEGYTFRRFLAEGREGIRPTMADWVLHLTTLFPEVRLKQYLEVRGMDSVDAGLAVALMAWWKGLLYSNAASEAAWQEVADLSWSERQQLHRDICTSGLGAVVRQRTVAQLASRLTAIADEGLRRLHRDGRAADETGFLDPIREILASPALAPAARLMSFWNGPWAGDRGRLVEYCSRITLGCQESRDASA